MQCLSYNLFVVYGKIYILCRVAVIVIVLWLLKNQGLQQFGVIPFEIRTLKKRHTEKWRARRIVYNKAIVDTEAPLVRGETEDICEFY